MHPQHLHDWLKLVEACDTGWDGCRCEVKVIDLGSSCFISDHLSSYVQSRSYRAPEVILGLPYDQKIDIWSFGCILAELLTGSVLFQVSKKQPIAHACVRIMPAELQTFICSIRLMKSVKQFQFVSNTVCKPLPVSVSKTYSWRAHVLQYIMW